MRKMKESILVALILAGGITGCLNNENVQPKEMAGITIYHSAPDAPDVKILIDNILVGSQAFGYKNYTVSTQIEKGSHAFKFIKFGDESFVVASTFVLEANKSYSIYIVNKLTEIELLLREDISDVLPAGGGKIRCLNLSPDSPKIDIHLNGEANPLFTGVTFKQSLEFKAIPINAYSIEVKAIGGNGRIVTIGDVQIKEGGFYTVLVEGFDNLPAGNTNVFSARVISH